MTKLADQISSGTFRIYAKEVERPGKVSIHLYSQAAMDIITFVLVAEGDASIGFASIECSADEKPTLEYEAS